MALIEKRSLSRPEKQCFIMIFGSVFIVVKRSVIGGSPQQHKCNLNNNRLLYVIATMLKALQNMLKDIIMLQNLGGKVYGQYAMHSR